MITRERAQRMLDRQAERFGSDLRMSDAERADLTTVWHQCAGAMSLRDVVVRIAAGMDPVTGEAN